MFTTRPWTLARAVGSDSVEVVWLVSLVRVVTTVSWLSPEPVAVGTRVIAARPSYTGQAARAVDASPADGTEQLEVSSQKKQL